MSRHQPRKCRCMCDTHTGHDVVCRPQGKTKTIPLWAGRVEPGGVPTAMCDECREWWCEHRQDAPAGAAVVAAGLVHVSLGAAS